MFKILSFKFLKNGKIYCDIENLINWILIIKLKESKLLLRF